MPQNPYAVVPAPTGYDATNDPMAVSNTTAQAVINLLCDRMGIARGQVQLYPVCQIDNVEPDIPTFTSGKPACIASNMAYYEGAQTITDPAINFTEVISNPAGDRLIVEIAAKLFACAYVGIGPDATIMFYPPYPPFYWPPVAIPSPFDTGNIFNPPLHGLYPRMRWAQFGQELILCRYIEPNSYIAGAANFDIQRYYVPVNSTEPNPDPGVLYEAGIATFPSLVLGGTIPPSSAIINYHTPSGSNVPKVGVIGYTYTLADEFGRENSPALATYLDFNANPTDDALIEIQITNPLTGPLQYYFLNIYATVQGGSLFFRIDQVMLTFGVNDIIYEDGTPDILVEAGVVGPRYGQNDPPMPANQICVFKNRLFLNSLSSPNTVQVSNLNSPTQFNSLGYIPTLGNVNDGITLQIDNDYGDPQYQMVVFASLLLFAKRKGLYQLYGQDASSFQVQPLQSFRGASSPDTFIRCENVLLYLSDDGVYQFDGINCTKLSKPIEIYLLQYKLTATGRFDYANSQAAYIARRYILNIGLDIYVFDLDAAQNGQSGWVNWVFGVDVNSWMLANYGQNPFPSTGNNPTNPSAAAGQQTGTGPGLPFPPVALPPGPSSLTVLQNPPIIPIPPSNPPVVTAYQCSTEIGEGVLMSGSGFSTLTGATFNGTAAATIIIYSDTSCNVRTPVGASTGMLVLTNPFGTFSMPVVLGGSGDLFNYPDTPLVLSPPPYMWAVQQGTDSYNVVSKQLDCGSPVIDNCTVTTKPASTANGWHVAQYILAGVGAAMQSVYRNDNGGSSQNCYAMEFAYSAGPLISISLFKSVSGTFTQIGSSFTMAVTAWPIGTMAPCSVHYHGTTHDVYIWGNLVTTFTDGTYTAAGIAGFRTSGTAFLTTGTRLCDGIGNGP